MRERFIAARSIDRPLCRGRPGSGVGYMWQNWDRRLRENLNFEGWGVNMEGEDGVIDGEVGSDEVDVGPSC